MPIRVGCPSCSAVLNAAETAAGRIVNCPKCQEPMLMPHPPAEAVDEPAATRIARRISSVNFEPADASDPLQEDDDDRPRRPRRKQSTRVSAHSDYNRWFAAGGAVMAILLLWAAGAFRPGKAQPAKTEVAEASKIGPDSQASSLASSFTPAKSGATPANPPPRMIQLVSRLAPLDGWSVLDCEDFAVNLPGNHYQSPQVADANLRQHTAERNERLGIVRIEGWYGTKPIDESRKYFIAPAFSYSTFNAFVIQSSKWNWDTLPDSELIAKANEIVFIVENNRFIEQDQRTAKSNVACDGRTGLEVRHQRTETYRSVKGEEKHDRASIYRAIPMGQKLILLQVIGYDGGPPADLASHFFDSLKIKERRE